MTNGNEPAFSMIDGAANYMSPGLTKREYIAARCMQGLLGSLEHIDNWDYENIAKDAVLATDALIKALNETP